jgi:hypothetical protein
MPVGQSGRRQMLWPHLPGQEAVTSPLSSPIPLLQEGKWDEVDARVKLAFLPLRRLG